MPAQILGILLLFIAIFIVGFIFAVRENRRIKRQEKPPARQSRIAFSQRVPTTSEILRSSSKERVENHK